MQATFERKAERQHSQHAKGDPDYHHDPKEIYPAHDQSGIGVIGRFFHCAASHAVNISSESGPVSLFFRWLAKNWGDARAIAPFYGPVPVQEAERWQQQPYLRVCHNPHVCSDPEAARTAS